jgi:hypothetical protein
VYIVEVPCVVVFFAAAPWRHANDKMSVLLLLQLLLEIPVPSFVLF